MEPAVVLAPGTERNTLAARFADVIRANVQASSGKREAFEELQGSVFVVVNDPPSPPDLPRASVAPGWGGALTLRFDLGQLTIHDGLVGVPVVTLRGAPQVIEGLPELKPSLGGRALRGALASLAALRWIRGQGEDALKVYGLTRHPRLTVGVLRVLSRHRW
ncbi:MAG: hypothetical protein H6718_13025 [Polyangiaceae bacterium]|nr:hypothetical protein [Polyangiaceae bacterium]MCB9606996.1 hypothetical protein [Polyangiaceae bacterium]